MISPSPQLNVDGRNVPLSGVWVHFQDGPYPGGQSYRLKVSRNSVEEWLGGHEIVLNELAKRESLFYSFFRDLAGQPSPFTHVLNSVAAVEVGDADIVFIGVCSPFVRSS